jgi:hypothetical protein
MSKEIESILELKRSYEETINEINKKKTCAILLRIPFVFLIYTTLFILFFCYFFHNFTITPIFWIYIITPYFFLILLDKTTELFVAIKFKIKCLILNYFFNVNDYIKKLSEFEPFIHVYLKNITPNYYEKYGIFLLRYYNEHNEIPYNVSIIDSFEFFKILNFKISNYFSNIEAKAINIYIEKNDT